MNKNKQAKKTTAEDLLSTPYETRRFLVSLTFPDDGTIEYYYVGNLGTAINLAYAFVTPYKSAPKCFALVYKVDTDGETILKDYGEITY